MRRGGQRPRHHIRMPGHREVGGGGLIRLGFALLPVPQRAERDVEAAGKLCLRQPQRAPQRADARLNRHPRALFGRERRRIGIGAHGVQHLALGQRVKLGPVGAALDPYQLIGKQNVAEPWRDSIGDA
jgi:hypothetical protein